MASPNIFADTKDVAIAVRKTKLRLAAIADRGVADLDNLDEKFAIVNPATLLPAAETATYQQLFVLAISARVHEANKRKSLEPKKV